MCVQSKFGEYILIGLIPRGVQLAYKIMYNK